MSNRIVESLYRVSGASFNEGVEEVSMLNTSKFGSVVSKLQDKFGQSFNEKPICSEVCEFLEKAVPQFDKVECAVFIKDGTDFIPISSHHSVIKFGDKILDFTNQQYDNHSEYGGNVDCPRIFKQVKDNLFADGNMIVEVRR